VRQSGATRQVDQRRMSRPAGSNFELWSWYFFRVSGVLMLILVFGHLLIVHIVNNVDVIDYRFVAERWQTIGWRVYDWLLLFLAIVHGQNGLRVVIDDYVHRRGWRVVAHTANGVFLGFFLVLGTLTIVSFPFEPGSR
jgi:succinate dehydrogenase / fumarate reductase membrane anchor subunit